MMKKILIILLILIFSAPIACWVLYKPIRVVYPEWVDGISCNHEGICIDDVSNIFKASSLYKNALNSVSTEVGSFKQNPHVIFCSTQECFESFGFKKAAAMSVSSLGIVISPRGWDGHFVRHEMIHHRQAEELGLLSGILKPEWLIEGMAYSLSFDPRMQLADQWQKDRIKFEAWYQKIGKKQLWKQASKL
jgi:hypothetical protein